MSILEFIKDHLLVLDGGMGTLLQERGLAAGERPERWNLSHPDEIVAIHKAYFDAGSNVVNTNTFGANTLHFSLDELEAILSSAIANAKAAAAASSGTQEKFIALDIGPTGRLLKPYGDLDFEEAVEIFATTVRLGIKHGVDLVMIETMNDSYETKAALLAVKENCDLPVFVSNAYGEDGKLMTGADPAAMCALLEGLGADVIGLNCSFGPDRLSALAEELVRVASVPVLLKPNAGLPEERDGRTVYNVLPRDFARSVVETVKKGVRIVGGCCGTTPEYVRALCEEIKGLSPVPVTQKEITRISSYTHAVELGGAPVLIGERINPTGKKRFKEALLAHDMDYLLQEGLRQAEKGAHILDVNVGLPDVDEPSMLTEAVCRLQEVTDLPLQIDTADPSAMESALRRYNGKLLINSVNGKRESLDAILPLAKKYGGVLIALTLDENGIPETAEGRLEIAKRILLEAEAYGISRRDIVFDPLTLTVSADPDAALVTLQSLDLIRRELGCHTSLGVSNVSFGLPMRDAINGTFFACALERGLSAAIMNPDSVEMMKVYRAFCALHGMDENCKGYVSFAEDHPNAAIGSAPVAPSAKASAAASAADGQTPLQAAIASGRRESAGALASELLSGGIQPLELIRREIIPALDFVGKGFEEKRVYLPQLLMSAEAAKAAFEAIRPYLSAAAVDPSQKLTVVIATVKGDIHDIGKNIVKLLLENYGFDVIDLGKDVPAEAVLDAVLAHGARLACLSALMTTTLPAMEETVRLLHDRAPACRVAVGGAVLTAEYASRIGADHYSKDAMGVVRYAEGLKD